MSFIRNVYFFIYLTVLLLFVFQKVDTKCEKDINEVKKIFYTAVDEQSLQPPLKSARMEHQELRWVLSDFMNTLQQPEPWDSAPSGFSRSESYDSASSGSEPITSFVPSKKHDAMHNTISDESKNETVLGKRKVEEITSYFNVASPKRDFSLCLQLAISCFEDVSKVVETPKKFTIRNATFDEYEEINNEDQQLQKRIADLILLPCSFTDTSGETINFFYSIVTKEEKPCVVLFKRNDNKLRLENVELYAITDDDAVLELINVDTSTDEEEFFLVQDD